MVIIEHHLACLAEWLGFSCISDRAWVLILVSAFSDFFLFNMDAWAWTVRSNPSLRGSRNFIGCPVLYAKKTDFTPIPSSSSRTTRSGLGLKTMASNTFAQKNFKGHNIHFSYMSHVLEHILCNLSNGWIKIFCGLLNIWSGNLTWFHFHESKFDVFCRISCEIEEPRSKKICWI